MRWFFAGALVLLLVACGSEPTNVPPVVGSVTVSPPTAQLFVEDSVTLSATVRSETGARLTDRTVTWSSSDTDIVAVSTGGVALAMAPGSAAVTATSEGVTGQADIVVEARPVTTGTLATAFRHSCALSAGGQAYCWGGNEDGQLGDGTNEARLTPTAVSGGHAFVQITARGSHTCGLTAAGAALCWGRNRHGQLGDGSETDRTVPTPVAGSLSFLQLAAGGNFTCGVTAGGEAYCWGNNTWGEVGNGTTTSVFTTPTPVSGGHSFSRLAGGVWHACGLIESGQAYCWGHNELLALGDGTDIQRLTPVPVSGSNVFAWLTAGWRHTCGLTEAGVSLCWGSNGNGQVGKGDAGAETHVGVPTEVQTQVALQRLYGGTSHTCGLDVRGKAFCWGANWNGQVGDGSTDDHTLPTAVSEHPVFQEISAGGLHTCAFDSDGRVHCWGDNAYGQLGNGGTDGALEPVLVGQIGS